MSTYGKKEKVCATCIYWKGSRFVDFSFITARNKEGKCGNEEGFYNICTIQGSRCSNWKGFSSGK